MPFVATQKTKAYYKRYQVKYRRRREGKTDYYQRKKLIIQSKNKYASPKYRLVVRKSNTQIIVQIVKATLAGDITLTSAYSSELPRYGLSCGLKNYAAAYCTGLLAGRRLLQKVGLFDMYTGVGNDEEDEVTGEIVSVEFNKKKYYVDELQGNRAPFKCYLDIGLHRTTLGAKIFGALKGASDAGLDIPHNHKKFPGYDPDEKEYDVDMHRDAIFGGSVREFMEHLEQEDSESGTNRMKEQFGKYVDAGIGPDDLEDLYKDVHKKIRADPAPKHKDNKKTRVAAVTHDKTYKKAVRLTLEQRKANVATKKAAMEAEEESSDEE